MADSHVIGKPAHRVNANLQVTGQVLQERGETVIAKSNGESYDEVALTERLRSAVAEVVQQPPRA